jgi:hypothetical protein
MALVQIEKDQWQETKQKFKEICPIWYGIIFEDKSEYVTIIDSDGDENYPCMMDGQVCVVGEAHGWSNDYTAEYDDERYCKTCDIYSGRFVDYHTSDSYLKKTVTGFVEHFEKTHG